MVEDFIHRRWQVNSHFLDGNCLWFATILTIRFPELEIYYLPIQGHFIVGKNNTYYDWKGKIILKEESLLFEYIKQNRPLMVFLFNKRLF